MDTEEYRSFPKPKTVKLTPYEKMVQSNLKERERRKAEMEEHPLSKRWIGISGNTLRFAPLSPKKVLLRRKATGLKQSCKKKSKRVKLPKQLKIKTLEIKLRKVMYPFIKQRDGNTCISCGKQGLVGGQYGNWNAGHFIKAELCNMIIRYDERNINSQCVGCNKWKAGNTIAYRFAMIAKYGLEVVEELEENYNKPLPMNFNHREWLLEQIAKYDNKES